MASSPRTWKIGSFFLYSILWLLILAAAALCYGVNPPLELLPHPTFTFNDVMPLWVPWAGALGGATISLVGTTEHAVDWDSRKYAYWHLCRPVLGAVFGVIGVLVLVLLLQGISPETKDGLYTAKGTAILAVIAFLLGYREETFRELVKRLVDTLVKPASAAAAQLLTLSPPTVDFGAVQANVSSARTLTIINRTPSAVTVDPSRVTFDVPSVTHGLLAPLRVASGADGELPLTWTPTQAGTLNGQVTIQTESSTLTSTLTGQV